ncbi:NAD(P)-dependent alcohol dehydrogenase [Amycolatopsis sp. cg9]|uniref:NAD(P)-dependent alcohol dehydrogenase n=1 Tax=Amycolatopsis sp. cg9 TaxID=3238801 RepID=UPI003523FBD2
MRAIVQNTYGPAEVLSLQDITRPVVGDADLLVRVHAAGLDPGVWHVMTGLPYLIRLLGYGFRGPKDRVRGRALAGRVEAVGKDVTRFRPGDDVYGTCDGSFAEYAIVQAGDVAPKPARLTFDQAAAVPISATTALQGLRDVGRLRAGQRVLVIGASGGIGTFAVQLAEVYGAHVTGVCSTSKTDLVRRLGAAEVVDYTREDFADGTRHYDLILDTAGNRPLAHLRRALAPEGTLVIVGGETGGRWTGGFQRSVLAALLSPFMRQHLRMLTSKENGADLRALEEHFEAGRLTPVIDRTYPLSEVPEAVRYLAEGHARGKVVITV